jgi:protein-S-isoprenylcysteine O-methyltransferase Ste14
MKIYPLAVAGGLAAAMLALHQLLPVTTARAPGQSGIALFLMIGAALLVLASAGLFRRRHTTVHPHQDASQLVTTGLYRFSRNPMYLGMLLALAGLALWCGQPFLLVFPAAFLLVMNNYVIPGEEQRLHTIFGEEYARYLRKTRRWL